LGAEAEEQPETAVAELGAKPVLAVIAQRCALPVHRSRRIGWHLGEDQLVERREQLGVGSRTIARRVLCRLCLDGCGQSLELIEEQRVREDGPAIGGDHG
jgi:hypothetical protein